MTESSNANQIKIFEISKIFQNENHEENIKVSASNFESNDSSVKINISRDLIDDSKNEPEEKKKKNKKKIATIIFLIFFFIELGFTIFMLYNLYYVFNRPSKEIDLSSNKYNNTLSFYSMSSNLGTINGTTLEMFHDVNISNNTKFIHISKIGYFYPDGTITNESFRIDTLYMDKIVFMNTNVLGRGDFKDSIDFDNITIHLFNDFNAVEVIVGKYKFASDGIYKDGSNSPFDYENECPTNSQLLEAENFNSGEIIGQHNRKLVILKDNKIFLRESGNDDQKIFELDDEKYSSIEFVNFVARNDEMGAILQNQYGNIKILNSKASTVFSNNIVSASLFKNKSLIYCTDDCHKIKIMKNIDKPENNHILLNNAKGSRFLAGRLYGGKIIIASPDLINDNNNQNILILNFKNPIDISTLGKSALITDYDSKEDKYNFYLFQNNQTKLIKSIQASAAKASFIHLNYVIISYSVYGRGTFYIKYDLFNDQLSNEIPVSDNCFDSFYISQELLSLFGNVQNYDFTFLEKFTI